MRRVVILAVGALLFLGCSGGDGQQTLQIISPHWQGIEDEFGPAFERHWQAMTGQSIKVVWRDMGGTSDDLRWIKSEFEKRPAGIDLDLFFGGGIDPYRQLKDLGVLVSFKTPDYVLSEIPPDIAGVPLYDGEYNWYGAAMSGFGIIYNKPLLAKLGVAIPKTWEDLTDPRLFTWVGTGDPRHSGTVHMMYEIILQAYGWERGWQIITATCANTKTIVQNSGDIPMSVAKGQIAAGTAIDFYAWTQVEQVGREQVDFVLPEGLTVINPDGIGILKGAPNLPAAQAFVEFVLSDAGQKLWYLRAGAPGGPSKNSLLRMPVRRNLYEEFSAESPVQMNPFRQSRTLNYNPQVGTARYEALNDLVGALIVDCHSELVACWKRIIDAGHSVELLPALAIPPVTEQELQELGATALANPVQRNTKIAEWVRFARDKYDRLEK